MALIDRIQVAGAGIIGLYVFSLDHCDPHATCQSPSVPWTIRIDFSFIRDTVVLRDIIPPTQAPNAHVIAALEAAVSGNLAAYRHKWWHFQHLNPASVARGACCLNNTKVQGKTAVSAAYDPLNAKTTVAFTDGSIYVFP